MSQPIRQLLTAVCVFVSLLMCNAEASAATDELSDLQIEKLTAFARTYGYVRFFHPSDQASLLDWNQMAVFGANEVLNSPESESTDQVLTRIFGPVVVDLEFYRGDQKARPETKKVSARKILAWQHAGVGIGRIGLYRSARTNRNTTEPVGNISPFANVLQAMDANGIRGKQVRFRFQAKVDTSCRLQGWFRVDRESRENGLFDNMNDRPITSTEWDEYQLSGTVDDDAQRITFGVMMFGEGSGLIDDAKLEVKEGDNWTELDIRNADFEQGEDIPQGWIGTAKGYDYLAENQDVAQGDQAMRMSLQTRTRPARSGFLSILPELGEVIDAEICDGLRVRLPLTLPADTRFKKGDDDKVDSFVNKVAKYGSQQHDVIATANIAITWSLFQHPHFYPYFDQIETDWDAVLVSSMKMAAVAKDRNTATRSLRWLVAQLHDGHGNVVDPLQLRGMKFLPLSVGWVEDQLVVLASDENEIKVGDIVTRIDGEDARSRLEKDEELISGSPQWKRYRSTTALSQVTSGAEKVALQLKSGDKEWTVEVATIKGRPPVPEKRPVIDTIIEGDEDGTDAIYYVDLGRAEPKDVDPMIEEFANAKGIVFDMRGYPRGTQYLFQHMTDTHMTSAKWLVSEQVRPDRVDMANFGSRPRWQMPPRKPRFKGKFVFITNGSAISYAESCMAIVAHYKLAEIIGSPTAEANGNINPFELPGGYRVIYTGMRVVNHDDSQHHVVGVKPTILVEPTIEGIRKGKDELLAKAVKLLKE